MLHFNELRITPDSKHLIIDVSIDVSEYYTDVVLDRIVIDTQDTYIMNGPSSNPVYDFDVKGTYSLVYTTLDGSPEPVYDEEDKEFCYAFSEQPMKRVRLTLSEKDLGTPVCGKMFFVYAVASGEVSPDTPCELRNNQIMGTVVNLYPFYQKSMCYVKELARSCQVPKNLIDLILRMKSIELYVKTGNYPQAIKFWNRFFAKDSCKSVTSNCGCNGGNY